MINKLTIKLKQHTPLIHFQHQQHGATLRASEVKPRLDKYILTQLGGGNYNNGLVLAKARNWLINDGKNNCRALDYMMRIKPIKQDKNIRFTHNEEGKVKTSHNDKPLQFPFVLSNVRKSKDDELIDFSYSEFVEIDIICKGKFAMTEIDTQVFYAFFNSNNFGQRNNKGFGSFTVEKVSGGKEDLKNEALKTAPLTQFPCMSFALTDSSAVEEYKKLFSVLDYYWKCLKSGINYSKRIKLENGRYKTDIKSEKYKKSYLVEYISENYRTEKSKIKTDFVDLRPSGCPLGNTENNKTPIFARALLGCPSFFEYNVPQGYVDRNNSNNEYFKRNQRVEIKNISGKIERIPTPYIFKPIVDNTIVRVYILHDSRIIESIRKLSAEELKFNLTFKNISKKIDVKYDWFNDPMDLIKSYHQIYQTSGMSPKNIKWENILGGDGFVKFNKIDSADEKVHSN